MDNHNKLIAEYFKKFNEPPIFIVCISWADPIYIAMLKCCLAINVKTTNRIINAFFGYVDYDIHRPHLKDNIVEENCLQKYIDGQKSMFKTALKELQAGKKISHYMWYIFPQIKRLGESFTSKHYAINDLAQANAFMQQGDLFKNLLIISEALLELKTNNPVEVFGQIDSMKLHSSMTLFYIATNNNIFKQVIDKYFNGILDNKTIDILHEMYTKEK